MPEGQLTPVQFEIMEAVWAAGPGGVTVAEIWQFISQRRSVARTTILNLVDRLEKRSWLKKEDAEGGIRFRAAVTREAASAGLAGEFISDFFGGSTSSLVMSLLGTQSLDSDEIARLRRLLDSATSKKAKSKPAAGDSSHDS